jgi:hypothetical protein
LQNARATEDRGLKGEGAGLLVPTTNRRHQATGEQQSEYNDDSQ